MSPVCFQSGSRHAIAEIRCAFNFYRRVPVKLALINNNSGRLRQAVNQIQSLWSAVPQVGVILGTGLGDFVNALCVDAVIPYEEISGFSSSTAIGHAGELVCGRIDAIPVVVLRGRTHAYEGASNAQMTFPVNVLHELGVRKLIVSCAAGGLSPAFQPGDLMLIEDHVDFQQRELHSSPELRGQTMTKPYDNDLADRLRQVAMESRLQLRNGTYVAVSGPNYETRAEMRFFRMFADAIGMSTVPEVTVARQLGMQVCGLATITNLCNPDALAVADGEHVVSVATGSEPAFRKLVTELIRSI